MNPSTETLPDSPALPLPSAPVRRWSRPTAVGLAVASLPLAWWGGVAVWPALGCAAGAAWLWRRESSHAPQAPQVQQDLAASSPDSRDGPASTGTPAQQAAQAISSAAQRAHGGHGARVGAEVMVAEVVPVWSRQMEVTRDVASEGLARILESFSQMSDGIATLSEAMASFQLSAEPGAVDQAVRRESAALDALTAASRRAFDERDAAVAELGRCNTAMNRLQQLAKQAREIARHTRLVAFNASIEANRNRGATPHGGSAEGGSTAVAGELRTLAGRMAETGEQVERVVHELLASLTPARREGEVADTSAEELRLEIDLHARRALAALLGAVGAQLQTDASLQQTSQMLRSQLDEAFVNFQFGDRVSQMLAIVGNDMDRFAQWVAENPRATHSDAAEWLSALEASYTMDEQRSTHHGNVVVEKSAGVEFF